MDETPEELEEIRRAAAKIDVNHYRKRWRIFVAIGLGGVLAVVAYLAMEMTSQARNPCRRVHEYVCKKDPTSLSCTTYEGIVEESEKDPSAQMRSNIRVQCVKKIDHLAEDGQKVP